MEVAMADHSEVASDEKWLIFYLCLNTIIIIITITRRRRRTTTTTNNNTTPL